MTVARYLCLALPLGLTAVVLATGPARRDPRREGGAALLAFIAAFVGIAALHEVATSDIPGWYAFAPVAGAFRGLPVDLWLGWAVLWGPLPVLLRRWLPLPVALGLLGWVDLLAMPALAHQTGLLTLAPDWLVGEAVGLLAVALPAQLLGRWTAQRRRLRARLLLQVTVFTGLTLWLVPTAAFTVGASSFGAGSGSAGPGGAGSWSAGSWSALLDLPRPWLLLVAQAAALAAVPGLAAVQEFAARGDGTPFPWDPPRRLVTTGPYAYLANPMQVSAATLVGLLAVATRSLPLLAAGAAAVAFSVAVAAPHEEQDLRRRFGPQWMAYRQHVRSWWPRLRPYPHRATIWLDRDCGSCRAVARFLQEHRPVGLDIAPASAYAAGPAVALPQAALPQAAPPRIAPPRRAPLTRARYEECGAPAGVGLGDAGLGDAEVRDAEMGDAEMGDAEMGDAGVGAVARGLGHLHLGWAYLGWSLRMPGVRALAQVVTDALIAPPHPAGTPRRE